MTEWELEFAAGERAAFRDRKAGRPQRVMDRTVRSPAWWAGYMPRNPAWALRPVQGRVWWAERDGVEA